jgi:RNA polymerase sigma factor (sigma-70 family)
MKENEMKDIRIKVQAYNNRLATLRERLGLNKKAIAKQIGIPYPTYVSIETMGKLPVSKTGSWSSAAVKIAEFHKMLPEDLFPEFMKKVTAKRFELEIDAADIPALPSPESEYFTKELNEAVRRVLATLTPRAEKVLRELMGIGCEEKSAKDIAEELQVPISRVKNLRNSALLSLRNPVRARHLINFVQPIEDNHPPKEL